MTINARPMDTRPITIRRADHQDVRAIARVQVLSCRESYRGVLAERALSAMDIDERERAWDLGLRDLSRTVFIAHVHGEIAGFGAARPATDGLLGTQAEITDLHVLRRWQCRGVGTRVLGALAASLREDGRQTLGVWLTRENIAGIAFCRALGGEIAAHRMSRRAGQDIGELALVWDRLNDLAFWNEGETADDLPLSSGALAACSA